MRSPLFLLTPRSLSGGAFTKKCCISIRSFNSSLLRLVRQILRNRFPQSVPPTLKKGPTTCLYCPTLRSCSVPISLCPGRTICVGLPIDFFRRCGGRVLVAIILLLIIIDTMNCCVRVLGETRRQVGRTRLGTRRTGRLGSTFLTGVDRRVHAPLGTVINFSGLLSVMRSGRRVLRCTNVVRAGARLLLRLVGSVLSVSGVRSKVCSFRIARISTGRLVSRIRRMTHLHVEASRISLSFTRHLPRYIFRASGGHLVRILAGLIIGTVGFASRKRVRVKCQLRSTRALCFCMSSANYNVSTRRYRRIFRHFIGCGAFVRNAKLKLSVYGVVVRGLKNRVKIRSRSNGNSIF